MNIYRRFFGHKPSYSSICAFTVAVVLIAALTAEGCRNSESNQPGGAGVVAAGITGTGEGTLESGAGVDSITVSGAGVPLAGTGGVAGEMVGTVVGTGGTVVGTGGTVVGTGGTVVGTGGTVVGTGGTVVGTGGTVVGTGGTVVGTGGITMAGAGGAVVGTGGFVGGSGGTSSIVSDDRPPCIMSPNEVVIIGDSYIVWPSHDLPGALAALAGESFRLYAEAGASMASGGIATLIPDQFEAAVADDPNVKAVVMDGGGNDILIVDSLKYPAAVGCKDDAGAATNPECQAVINDAIDTAIGGMDRMVEVGVKDVIYFFYPNVPEPTVIGGTHPNEALKYSLPLAKETCESAFERTGHRLRCHFIDMVPVFKDHPEYFASTDIHPSSEGAAAMAQAIWNKMQEVCVGQYESSGCCAP